MIYAVFLCDKTWNIRKILRQHSPLALQEGVSLTSLLDTSASLPEDGEHHCILLTFTSPRMSLPAVIHAFPEGALILLSHAQTDEELMELFTTYQESISWAKDHFQGLYHNEYYLIQQMNNQLIDSKRALARSNMRLEQLITEMKSTNEQLEIAKTTAERAMQVAEHANQSKTQFMASISHDIRTPLNAILGLATLMEHELDHPDTLKNYIKKLQYSGEHLLGLINDILDMSQIESGSTLLHEGSVDLQQQLEQIATIIRPQAEARKQTFAIRGENVTHLHFISDATRLRQVLLNLLSNAVKYTPENGKIDFTIQELKSEKEGYISYRFTVRDSGIGMSEEFIQHIFEPYARSEKSAGSIQGTGLGMTITKNIIDMMNGTIHIESTPEKGSTFIIDVSFQEDATTPDTSSNISGEESTLEGKHFLCAEDNELNAEILSSMLELSGASCKIYENGKLLADAFEHVKPGEYDAILMDVQMPVMNGYEATDAIRNSKNPLGTTIPIIAMTANSFAEDIERCLAAGMDAHIGKPIQIETLIQILNQYTT